MVELTPEQAVYKYYPEKSDKNGVVILHRKTGEREIIETVSGYGNNYAGHALRRIERYQQDGNFLHDDVIVWY